MTQVICARLSRCKNYVSDGINCEQCIFNDFNNISDFADNKKVRFLPVNNFVDKNNKEQTK